MIEDMWLTAQAYELNEGISNVENEKRHGIVLLTHLEADIQRRGPGMRQKTATVTNETKEEEKQEPEVSDNYAGFAIRRTGNK